MSLRPPISLLFHITPLEPHPFTPDQSNEVDATPFLKTFNLISSGSVGILSSKIYQNRCIADVNPPTQKYPLPHKNGLYFGKSHLSLPAETFGIDSTSKDPSSLSTHPFDPC
ncbi:hypothetical protein RO3G_10922 [Rhizopus delemar RA 99-880]|uniref:Uncharacterized protein n=1 Tax=Rhizopus delemar (strain RA 99-880 / ATCC MYA-4621 / FGSC 9543 / NRRL 43880) TaxID=246409 RepID=I1CCN1_RHIO9|nr:hypothetical protein RO3G_10922 [Rhizopus delemar RA 99-880]|eukprot:EIE86211.1 hypothetical protein RO3G_10922 [Rhizopus delemar RA 99-880]